MADQPPEQGREPTGPATELARLKKAIADMAAANVRLDKERKDLAGKIQIAQHRYDVLAHAVAEQQRGKRGEQEEPGAGKRRTSRPAGGTAPRASSAGAGRVPPPRTPPGGAAGPASPGGPARPRVQVAPPPPEASSRFVQTIMLGLSVLLLAIAAVVFVSVITELESWGQLLILLGTVALALAAAPPLARRGLTATAETVAVVGLLLVSVAGYAMWNTEVVAAVSVPVYSGLVAASTAIIGYGYHLLTRLDVPRWIALLALQPVLPLVAYPLITGPVGWGLVLALMGAHNAAIATLAGRRPLGYLAWVLHAVAVAAAAGYSVAGLAAADNATTALPAAGTLVLAAGVGVAGALGLREDPLPDVAAGLLTIAVIVSAGRVLALALPGQALLPVTAVTAVAAVGVRLLPAPARRGPLWAVITAFAVIGVVVAGLALRAGVAVTVLPPWPVDLVTQQAALADAAAVTAGGQLAPTAAALTAGAALAVPRVARRESVVAGVALTALAAPVSFGLGPVLAPWVLAVAVAAIAVTGLGVATERAATVHIGAGTVVGLAAAGASLASPVLTAAVLTALTLTGVVVGAVPARHRAGRLVSEWAAGAATLALPGAAATGAVAAGIDTSGMLVVASLAVCVSLGYASVTLLRHRFAPVPVQLGSGIATLVVAGVALAIDGAAPADRMVAVLLVTTLALVLAAPRIELVGRPDRALDGADLAAAALTATVVATLARLAALVLPVTGSDAMLATAATLVFAVAVGVRAIPRPLRRGPVLGVSTVGVLLAALAGAAAVVAGAQVLAAPGPLWDTNLSDWWPPATTVAELTWAAPLTLLLLAVAAALLLPRPTGSRVSAGLAVLATVAAPVALGLEWWTPAALSAAMGTGYALSAVVRVRRHGTAARTRAANRAATGRAVAGGTLLLYAVGAALARPWTTAAVLGTIVVVGVAVAGLATRTAAAPPAPGRREQTGSRTALPLAGPRLRIGGTAVVAVLLAMPAGLAAVGAQLGHPGGLTLLAALAGSSLGLAMMAALPTRMVPYLPYGTAGVAAGATGTAFFALPPPHPAGVYAAAAVLLAVLAELLRAARRPPGHRSLIRPPVGAIVASAVPAIIALIALAPALFAALAEPYQVLAAPWQGPPPALTDPSHVHPSSVIAALLLTLAAGMAAVGFGGAVTRQAVPLVAPGLAVTLLITPAALGAPWPAGTAAALAVFTITMLGVALTPPPPVDASARPLWITRMLVLGIGLAAGGAGLAGALAAPDETWGTFGGAVAVGASAALWGKTHRARMLGWLGAVLAAQLFALTTAFLLGANRPELGFALLAVGAICLLAVARLPRLRSAPTTADTRGRLPQLAAARELMVVEWLGGYASLVAALLFTIGSAPDTAAVLIGGGAVLGVAALHPGRPHRWRRGLWWTAVVSEVIAWWIIMRLLEVGLLEAYTLPFALLALLVGMLEVRYRPELGSWVTWGPGLVAALGPSLIVVITTTTPEPARQAYVLIGGVAALLLGSRLRQRAPVIIGTAVTAVGALHLLSLAGPWLVLVPLGLLLLILGANREKRERDLARLRGAYHRMR